MDTTNITQNPSPSDNSGTHIPSWMQNMDHLNDLKEEDILKEAEFGLDYQPQTPSGAETGPTGGTETAQTQETEDSTDEIQSTESKETLISNEAYKPELQVPQNPVNKQEQQEPVTDIVPNTSGTTPTTVSKDTGNSPKTAGNVSPEATLLTKYADDKESDYIERIIRNKDAVR